MDVKNISSTFYDCNIVIDYYKMISLLFPKPRLIPYEPLERIFFIRMMGA
jgi:hypothetical protein